MAKRKPQDQPAGSPAWMSTFSDLMNLLLCFFVMLFSMSNIDEFVIMFLRFTVFDVISRCRKV